MNLPTVLVLGGGPDAERAVSLDSARSVAQALRDAGFAVHHETIDRPSLADLRGMHGDVVFPVLHGAWGEGGPLQDMLNADGRPYVGSAPRAARVAMDKLATKLIATRLGVPTPVAVALNIRDAVCPLDLPVVVKPVHEGSSVGLHLCRDDAAWEAAFEDARRAAHHSPGRVCMAERLIQGRELTVGLVARNPGGPLSALPVIEIVPAAGPYDYGAKYERDDTGYRVGPDLPADVADRISRDAERLAAAIGVRDLARVDFLLDADDQPWLLEINTMPGFTSHSLLPRAARAVGLDMPALCGSLVLAALARQPAAARS
ncbi:MAG: D-alanine--D-alanine ligase [Phycisphaeraceae bacterium]|nr:D-alanine--D-alanine ligase [Phycisphaeraceae bacterium]